MLGCRGNEAAAYIAIDAAHWMHTGDLATMDGDGHTNVAISRT